MGDDDDDDDDTADDDDSSGDDDDCAHMTILPLGCELDCSQGGRSAGGLGLLLVVGGVRLLARRR